MGIAAAAMLASCSLDETLETARDTRVIGFSNAFVDNATRSVVDPSFTVATLRNFAVYGFTQNGQIFDGVTVSSADNGSTWTYNPIQYWVEGNQYAFAAIAPASVPVSGETLTGSSVADYKVGMTVSFTNDGKMTEHLTHPSYDKKKIYQVTLDKPLTKEDFDSILKGIWLSDGMINADEMAYVDNDRSVIGIAIHSGRNRIIRRIFESLGYKVTKLDRVYFAGLTKKGLRRGEWRYLDQKEVNILMMGAYE